MSYTNHIIKRYLERNQCDERFPDEKHGPHIYRYIAYIYIYIYVYPGDIYIYNMNLYIYLLIILIN